VTRPSDTAVTTHKDTWCHNQKTIPGSFTSVITLTLIQCKEPDRSLSGLSCGRTHWLSDRAVESARISAGKAGVI
jgi:hypothetical protein